MAETAKKISMIPAKVQYDRNVKLSEKKMKVAAYCRVSTELEEQDSSYEAQVEYYTSKISENENWKNVFCRVMTELEDYHFVRMVSREGAAVLPLLKSGVWKENDKDFLRDAMKETELMAALHPGYLKEQQSVIQLSENAIRILRLQAEGMSREDVVKELDQFLEAAE